MLLSACSGADALHCRHIFLLCTSCAARLVFLHCACFPFLPRLASPCLRGCLNFTARITVPPWLLELHGVADLITAVIADWAHFCRAKPVPHERNSIRTAARTSRLSRLLPEPCTCWRFSGPRRAHRARTPASLATPYVCTLPVAFHPPRWRRWSLLMKIEGDPLNTQHVK